MQGNNTGAMWGLEGMFMQVVFIFCKIPTSSSHLPKYLIKPAGSWQYSSFFLIAFQCFIMNTMDSFDIVFRWFDFQIVTYQNVLKKIKTLVLQCPLFPSRATLQCCAIHLSFECLNFHI